MHTPLACAPTHNPALRCALQSSRCTSSCAVIVTMSGFEGRLPSTRYQPPNGRGASRLNARIPLWRDQPPAFMSLLCAAMRPDPAVAQRPASANAPEATKISVSVAMQCLVFADKVQDMHEKQRIPDGQHRRWLHTVFQYVDELLAPLPNLPLECSPPPASRATGQPVQHVPCDVTN